jgi:hypothetical protein
MPRPGLLQGLCSDHAFDQTSHLSTVCSHTKTIPVHPGAWYHASYKLQPKDALEPLLPRAKGWVRTTGQRLNRALLYQLSYSHVSVVYR